MKRISKHKFVSTVLPKNNCIVMGGRASAIYHWYGYVNELCKDPTCPDCPEVHTMIEELIVVDDGFRREWRKRFARYARVPQRQRQRAEYRRKHAKARRV